MSSEDMGCGTDVESQVSKYPFFVRFFATKPCPIRTPRNVVIEVCDRSRCL